MCPELFVEVEVKNKIAVAFSGLVNQDRLKIKFGIVMSPAV